jgi:restriction system-associated AAA family ATPase
MKILSVKILGEPFRSLAANKLYEFNKSYREDRLSTKVFAGLNGSGKSNFLELFSEIFYHLEICNISTVSNTEKQGRNIGFEIEYLLPADAAKIYSLFQHELSNVEELYITNNLSLTQYSREDFRLKYNDEIEQAIMIDWQNRCKDLLCDNYLRVRVTKQLGEMPVYALRKNDDSNNVEIIHNTNILLPKRIIAYTSGQNELLSNPYYKIKYHYFKEFADNKQLHNNEIAEENRLFFLDYSSNFSIFIANMLLASNQKLEYLKDVLHISGLKSFRITINLMDAYKKSIPISDRLMIHLQKLKLCATSWARRQEGKEDLLILDYFVTESTKEAFRFHFKRAFNLFKVFYELDILNLHLVKKDTRGLMLRVHKHFNFSDELPKGDPSRLVFRLEQILITKRTQEAKERQIYYKGLSDGEHQFNEVVGTVLMMEQEGCLFLMDEPDTHFNPKWRAKMIEMLNYVTAKSFIVKERIKLDINGNTVKDNKGKPIKENITLPETVRRQEIIITTHSPFVISDSQKEDVYKFDKVEGTVTYINPKIETYGASVGLLLQEIFDRKISISDLSNFDMDEWRREFMELLNSGRLKSKTERIQRKINEVKNYLIDFGESIEKFDLYSFIRQVEKEINTKK